MDTDDAKQAARAARLRYVSDGMPGIRRERAGEEFRYVAPDGTAIEDQDDLARIRTLGIPPAWTDVWICPNSRGHLQATGRDARGRKQYRYHPRWRAVRDETKYERMLAFGEALPRIRQRALQALSLPGLPREKILATVVLLLDLTHIRIGNQEYARENESFGLTTLQNEHVAVESSILRFRFRGKAGKEHRIDIQDRRLARIVARCQDLPGQELFKYVDEDGEPRGIDSEAVNEYLQEISGEVFTAKDFRTWAGTLVACCALKESGAFATDAEAKRHIVEAIKAAAEHLGNTPAICKKCYVHPAVIDSYLDGSLLSGAEGAVRGEATEPSARLRREEEAVLVLLRRAVGEEDRGAA